MLQPFHVKKPSFTLETGPNHSKLLDQLSTKASWSISGSKPIFFYLYGFTSSRAKALSSSVQRYAFSKKVQPYEPRVVVHTGNKTGSKLAASCHIFFKNKTLLLKKKKANKQTNLDP